MTVETEDVPATIGSVEEVRRVWSVAIDGFSECYVEADTKASARWCAASACHAAGYGRSPVDLLSRGVSVHPSSDLEADLFSTRTLIAPRRNHLLASERGV